MQTGQHPLLTQPELAEYLVRWLLMLAEGRRALSAAIAWDQAASDWERCQWERLSQVLLFNPCDGLLANTVDAFLSSTSSGTPCTSTQDNNLGSGVSVEAGNETSRPVFRAPPGLHASTHYPPIFEEDWNFRYLLQSRSLLSPTKRGREYYAGRARRQRRRRQTAKEERWRSEQPSRTHHIAETRDAESRKLQTREAR